MRGIPARWATRKAPEANKRFGIKGPQDNPEPRMSKQAAEEKARNTGILGIMNKQSSKMASIFSREMALGNNPEDAFGHLLGAQIGDAAGLGGLGPLGTGPDGGGTGENTLGTGTLDTIGSAGRDSGGGSDYGRNVALLTRPRRSFVPEVVPGTVKVHGSLDKEIIRRIVHQHMNEVKFCYDQELARRPTLAGRISVQFAISPVGQVITSVMQSHQHGRRARRELRGQCCPTLGIPQANRRGNRHRSLSLQLHVAGELAFFPFGDFGTARHPARPARFARALVTTESTEVTEPDRKGKGWVLSGPNPFFFSDLCVLCALCGETACSQQSTGAQGCHDMNRCWP